VGNVGGNGMIVWVASVPRSGNSFFRSMLYKYYGINTYSVNQDRFTGDSCKRFIGQLDLPASITQLDKNKEWVIKTHARPSKLAQPCKSVYIVRDVRDVLVSRAKYRANKSRSLWYDELRQLVEEGTNWHEHVADGLEHADAVVTYEDLHNHPFGAVQDAVVKLGVDWTPLDKPIHIPSFDELKVMNGAFFRRGKAGSWKDEMPHNLALKVWEQYYTIMEELGYAKS
jgi:hypothetical protein